VTIYQNMAFTLALAIYDQLYALYHQLHDPSEALASAQPFQRDEKTHPYQGAQTH
jgi:hypothetical protein